MKTLSFFFALSALAFVGCDSRQENARENAIERKADSLEDAASATKKQAERAADATEDNKKVVDQQAENIRKDGDRKAEALKDAADVTRDQK